MKMERQYLNWIFHSEAKVINIRQYLLTVLYNAPLTISNYYSALVQHDMYGDSEK